MRKTGISVAPVMEYTAKILQALMMEMKGDSQFTYFEGRTGLQIALQKNLHAWLWTEYGLGIAYGHIETYDSDRKKHVCRFGVCVGPNHRGQGYGTKIVAKLLEEAKKLNLWKVNASVYADNAPMLHIYKSKYGFAEEGRYKNEERWDGEWRDVVSLARWI